MVDKGADFELVIKGVKLIAHWTFIMGCWNLLVGPSRWKIHGPPVRLSADDMMLAYLSIHVRSRISVKVELETPALERDYWYRCHSKLKDFLFSCYPQYCTTSSFQIIAIQPLTHSPTHPHTTRSPLTLSAHSLAICFARPPLPLLQTMSFHHGIDNRF